SRGSTSRRYPSGRSEGTLSGRHCLQGSRDVEDRVDSVRCDDAAAAGSRHIAEATLRTMPRLVLAPALVAVSLLPLVGCAKHSPSDPALPVNRSPVLDSLVAYPDTIGPSDSTTVVCFAREPDGDTLFFDWQTDARLNIKGTPTWNKYFNNQISPAQVFY